MLEADPPLSKANSSDMRPVRSRAFDRKGTAGKFELAHKGTIFLDKIGDMPMRCSRKKKKATLGILQDRIVERIGWRQVRKLDFRLISATN